MKITTFLCLWTVMLAILACGNGDAPTLTIFPTDVHLRDGDIALRRGCGIASRAVMFADKGSVYSHVGIVALVDGRAMVVHAVPDEPDFPGDVDRVKMEPIERFYSPVHAKAGRILRLSDSVSTARAARTAVMTFRRKTLFDHDYDERDTVRMYCSELVAHSYEAAGNPIIGKSRHSVNLPGMKLDAVIFPSDFLRSEELITVSAFAQ